MIVRYAQLVIFLARHDREHHLATVYEMIEELSNQRDILAAQSAALQELSEEVKRLKKKYESLPSVLED